MKRWIDKWTPMILTAVLATAIGSVRADPPPLIRYQARLTDTSGTLLTGAHQIGFALFDDNVGGMLLWSEGPSMVDLGSGSVDFLLGAMTPLTSDLLLAPSRWLEVTVDGAVLTPRQRLSSVPFSLVADRLGTMVLAEVLDRSNHTGTQLPSTINPQGSASEPNADQVDSFDAGNDAGQLAVNNGAVNISLNADLLDGSHLADIQNFSPPVGAIIQYFGAVSSLPANWKVCDGSVVNDPASSLNGIVLPDLRGRFARGETDINRDIPVAGALTGGTDNLPGHSHTATSSGSHSHSVNSHSHGLPASTGSVSNSGSNPGGHSYLNRDDNQGWNRSGTHIVIGGGASSQEGQHRHDLGGSTVSSSPGTNTTGSHSHTISSVGSTTNGNIPRYVALHFIIRIK